MQTNRNSSNNQPLVPSIVPTGQTTFELPSDNLLFPNQRLGASNNYTYNVNITNDNTINTTEAMEEVEAATEDSLEGFKTNQYLNRIFR